MEGPIRGHLAEASRPSFRGGRFEVQEQAMINLGVPEAVAGDRVKAFILFAGGDADYVSDDVPSILGRPARSLEQFAAYCAAVFS